MYDRETVKNTKKLFYTSFGKYISRERSSSGLKVKWINYETGIKSIFVRLDANQKNAKVCIDILKLILICIKDISHYLPY